MTSLRDAAKWYAGEDHQIAAWEALEAKLPKFLVEEFLTAYKGPVEAPSAVEEPSIKTIVTPEIFEQLTGYSASLFTQQECDDCNRLFHETGFADDIEATRDLMANILHETGNMRWLKELSDGWYLENRSDLGNTHPGDGPRFRGCGILQLTGRYNYSRLAAALNDPRVMEGCDYVATTYPFTSAKTWIEENNLLWVSQNKGFDAVCRRINGGWNGIQDRRNKREICARVLK